MIGRGARLGLPVACAALLAAVALAAGSEDARSEGPFFRKALKEWRDRRVASLKSEDGWLTLVGLHWLEPGENPFGSDPSNRIVLPEGKAPARAGSFVLEGSKVRVRLLPASPITIDGRRAAEGEVRTDESGDPDVFRLGTVSFHVIRRGDRFAVRVKDSRSPVRTGFSGLDFFPPDASYRVQARFTPYDPPKAVDVPNVLGGVEVQTCPGIVRFELEGKEWTLEPLSESGGRGELFFIFKDATSGRETYAAGRFLYADPPSLGRVVLDFNRAFNPPCAFTPYATCPLPPKQNWLPIRIEAGEKAYTSSAGHGEPARGGK